MKQLLNKAIATLLVLAISISFLPAGAITLPEEWFNHQESEYTSGNLDNLESPERATPGEPVVEGNQSMNSNSEYESSDLINGSSDVPLQYQAPFWVIRKIMSDVGFSSYDPVLQDYIGAQLRYIEGEYSVLSGIAEKIKNILSSDSAVSDADMQFISEFLLVNDAYLANELQKGKVS